MTEARARSGRSGAHARWTALVGSVAVALGACDRRGVDAPPARATTSASSETGHADGGAPRSPSVPPVQATLHDDAWKLSVRLDPRAPAGTLEIRGEPSALEGVELILEHEELTGSVVQDGGTRPVRAMLRYRLRFAIDACAHAAPTPQGRWPELCGHGEGQPRPKRLDPYELLVDIESFYWSTGEAHVLAAACVPRSGAGPSCKLAGTAAALDP